MNKSQKILVALFFLSSIGMANHGRYEQYWSDYEDFANNRGKFKIGQKGVIVYKKEGLGEAATIEQPIPNFDGMVDGGAYALWGDPQILSTASHVGNWGSFTFIQRHLRKDVELSEGFKNKANTNKDSIVQEYSERVKMPYMRDLGNDYSIGRLKTIAFDGYTPETIKNRSQIHYGDLVARTGGGVNSYAQDGGERYPVGYGNIAGGLNKIYHVDGGSFWIQMNKKFQTPLDSASRPGDSGSPAYIWDKDNNKWLLAGENSAGSGDNNWNKKSIIKQNPDAVNAYLKSIEDEKIIDANVTLEGKTLGFGNSTRVIDDNVATAKNQTFAKNGLTLTVNSDSDTGASRFRFSENANITGTGKFSTAGLIIDKNVNVNYNIISDKNTVIRKRGEGSLTLNANSKNDVEVNIGEGSLILDNSNGYAASHIRVAQGAKVILNKDNQLNDNKIYFGHRGGTLELKGQNLEFNDIYHLDKDAIIANKESTTKSKFTFTQGKDRVFLGKFSGNMDVEYNPNEVNENSKWNLRGNTDITGDLNIKKGIVSISGDVITSGYENNVLENQFEKTTFKAGNINIDNGSTLQLDRATKVDGNINVSGKLDLTATGEVLTKLDETKPYKDYEDQSEVNKVNVNGNITFKNGIANNFNVNVENNNLVEINSKISGTINGIKDGDGLLKIKNSNNNFTGSLDIKDGVVESENENILSNGKYKIEEKGLLRVNNNSNLNVLDKIDKTSTGVISLGNSLAELDKKYADYTNLYIGSKNDITIGANNKAIDKSISNINLGGDNGTVTLKGLELEDGTTVRNINAGNDKHRGNVVIDGLSNDAKVNITIRDGINFVVNNNRSNSQFLDLGYGATAGTSLKNNLKDTSIGVLELTNENSIEVKKVAIGAKKDSNVILNSYTTTNDKTRFSGEGNLTYTSTLENKELEVDAQNLSGGVVTLTGDNKDFTNKVTVMGNKNGVNNGSITLKLGSEMLKHKNEVLIKDGGILDINDNDVSIKLNNASNKYGTLTNSGTNKVDVTLDSNEATTINTTLTGNLNIIKKGTGTLKFDNKNNFKGNVVMNGGELIYDKDVLENDIILNKNSINRPTVINISSNKSNGDIKSSLGSINVKENANININSVTALNNYQHPIYDNLNIYGISRDRGSINIGKVTIENGAYMYVTKQRMTMQSLSAKDNSVLTLDQASLKLVYSDNTILSSGLKELELKRSKLYLRDYKSKIEDKNSSQLTKVVVSASNSSGDSEIINGESLEDNGGGGGATFVNPIVLRSNKVNTASLIFKSGGFFGSGTGLTINAKVSGEGVIKLERNNGAKFEIQDNFKDFTGKVMSNNKTEVNYDFNISSDNSEDRVIGYNLTGIGSYTNKSNKDLTFTNLSGFTGKLVAQNGDIVLKDENAINNTAKVVETYGNSNIKLLSDNDIDVTGINLENKNTSEGNTNKVIKDGSGKLSLGVNTNITNFKILEVKSGELELKKNIEVSNIDLKDSTKLDLNFINDGTITSEIIGTGDLIKIGTTKIDIEGSKLNSTGSIDLQSGELSVTGNKVLSNKVKG
ncbi:MAG: S6 family peptidase, partial [Streptobacillus sp.]